MSEAMSAAPELSALAELKHISLRHLTVELFVRGLLKLLKQVPNRRPDNLFFVFEMDINVPRPSPPGR